jgi:aminobenzoyl-glutamate utilization protein A
MTEFRTASIVAERLTALGLDVKLGREVMDSASRIRMPSETAVDLAYKDAEANGAPEKFLPAFAGGHTGVVGKLKGAAPGPTIALRVDMGRAADPGE